MISSIKNDHHFVIRKLRKVKIITHNGSPLVSNCELHGDDKLHGDDELYVRYVISSTKNDHHFNKAIGV